MRETLKQYTPILMGKWLEFLLLLTKKRALNKAFLLFSTPLQGKMLPEQEYFLEEAEDEIVDFKNLELQTYRWAGSGETVLLVHGWESNTYRWKLLIEKLQKENYNIIAFDAPAQGQSTGKILNIPLYADCLQKIIELYRPHHLIGHSVGGMTIIFQQYSFKNPEIQKLVILAPPTKLATIMKGYQKTLNLSAKFMKSLDTYFKNKYGFYFKEFSMIEFAKELTKEGLIIHDKYDKIASYEEAAQIAAHWKAATFMTTENYGHSLFYDDVDESIINFLKAENK